MAYILLLKFSIITEVLSDQHQKSVVLQHNEPTDIIVKGFGFLKALS